MFLAMAKGSGILDGGRARFLVLKMVSAASHTTAGQTTRVSGACFFCLFFFVLFFLFNGVYRSN